MIQGEGYRLLYVLVAFLAGNHAQENRPSLDIYPSRVPIIEALGESMLITCSVSNIDDPTINPDLKWFTPDNVEIRETAGLRYIEKAGPHSLKLYFTAIRLIDSGEYTCKGELEGSWREKKTDIQIFKDITFDHAPSPQVMEVNTDALIECEVSGQPVPTVSWRYAGQTIVTGGRYVQEQRGLRIHGITQDDDDYKYLCRAEILFEGRYEERQITVDVQVPPTLIKPMGTQEGIAEHEATFQCFATADPPPKYEFYKDGSENKLETNNINMFVDRDAGKIDFRPISKHNAGSYRCRAFNDVGSVEDTGILEVWVRPKIITLINQTAEEGQSQQLECIAEGNPAPGMTFQKIRHEVVFPAYEMGDNDGGRVRVTNPSTGVLRMEISELTPEDTANYTCKAVNLAGDMKLNGTVIVYHSPRFAPDHPDEFYLWAGKTRNITCFSISEPEPTFKWFKDGKELRNNETYKIYDRMHKNSNLQISARIEDQGWVFGRYTCRAVNNYGTGETTMNIIRATVPSSPTNVTVLKSGPTMVVFRPSMPVHNGGIPVTEYRLEFDQSQRELDLDEDILVENLNPQTTYIFKIRAGNEVGFGEAYDLTFKTDSIRAPSPLILNPPPSKPEFAYGYRLTWQKPETGGLEIDEYEFKIRKVKVDDSGRVVEPLESWVRSLRADNPDFPIQSANFENLSPSSYYELQARARNDIGWSQPNTEYVFETGDDPEYGHIKGLSCRVVQNSSLVILLVLLHALWHKMS